MNVEKKNIRRRERRKRSVRSHIRDVSDRPRLSVFRSSKHIYAQVIDDAQGRTVCAFGSAAKSVQDEQSGKTKTDRAKLVGAEIARRAVEAGVESVVFDRGLAKFTGRVKALADAAREAGLKF